MVVKVAFANAGEFQKEFGVSPQFDIGLGRPIHLLLDVRAHEANRPFGSALLLPLPMVIPHLMSSVVYTASKSTL